MEVELQQWSTRRSVRQIRKHMFDTHIRHGALKGFKAVREIYRKRIVDILISFLATSSYEHLRIDFYRDHDDEYKYYIHIREDKSVAQETNNNLKIT